jgi:hypothetical protein
MLVFKKYDRQNHVWSFMTKYLQFLCKFTSWSGETPTCNFSDVFLSWTRIMSVLIGWPFKTHWLRMVKKNFTHGFVYHISWRQAYSFIAFINILWVSTVFSTPYLFLDTAARLPVTHFSTFYQFFLNDVS